MSRYLLKPTKTGWYLALKNCWRNWTIKSGWFTPIDLMWCLDVGEFQNPRYITICILGFEIEIGKFESKNV